MLLLLQDYDYNKAQLEFIIEEVGGLYWEIPENE